MPFELTDNLEFTKPRRTTDGYLVADVRTARTGIQLYRGSDVGITDKETVRIYRPEDEVFKDTSMASFAHKPITDNHPPVLVDSKNWKKYSVGKTGSEVARDGEFIVIPMSVMDATTIDAIESGKRELSAGYTCDIDFTAGTTPDGETYDAVQRNIRINHIAVVDKGRAGPSCRIGDKTQEKETPMPKVVVDGITIDTTEQGAEVIAKLQKQVSDSTDALSTAKTDHTTAIAAKDKELGEKDAEIEKLKGEKISDADLDAMVADRASVVEAAKKIDDSVETAGKSNADIRRAVVAKKFGDATVKDKSDDYVQARFDALVDAAPTDPVRKALKTVDGGGSITDSGKEYDAHKQRLQDAWKGEETK